MLTMKNVMPFMGVEFDRVVGDFRVITYQAYNAFGLIGPESNGIAILNEKESNVLLDEHFKQSTGYFGVGDQVTREAERICDMIKNDFEGFRAFVNVQKRSRYDI